MSRKATAPKGVMREVLSLAVVALILGGVFFFYNEFRAASAQALKEENDQLKQELDGLK